MLLNYLSATCLLIKGIVRSLIMHRRTYLLRLLVFTVFLIPWQSYSDPIPYFDPIGARSVAMGGATAALSGSPTTVYHNPAAMVYQVLTGGFGIQPWRFGEYPESWWVNIYNRSTEFGVPVSLLMQGWRAHTQYGRQNNFMIGIPLTYKISPYSPAAVDVKWAFERTPDGNWIGGVPFDFGFMTRTNKGAQIGWVLRNVTIGRNRFETMPTRVDYGIAYETGIWTISVSSSADEWSEAKDVRNKVRTGFELATNRTISLRGGYVRWDGGKWFTGGVGLSAGEGGMYFDYGFIYDNTNGGLTHFLQYVYMIRP